VLTITGSKDGTILRFDSTIITKAKGNKIVNFKVIVTLRWKERSISKCRKSRKVSIFLLYCLDQHQLLTTPIFSC
ncbi:MAG: hypothetical protein AAGC43_17695, partial [Bacteroidota bacterium]